jgi:hypothetical protein
MKWWHVVFPTVAGLVIGSGLVLAETEAYKERASCEDSGRKAELYGGYTGSGVRLREDGMEIFDSYGYYTVGQARNVAAEFCETAKVPEVQVNVDRTLLGILGEKLTCESVAGHNFASAALGAFGASASISGQDLTDISDGYKHLNYVQARAIALNHCKTG